MTQKNKIISKFHRLHSKRGSAIVCAIGVLTAILIIVMLFASRAKVSSTISAIQLDNQTAKTLAKSLIPRIILTLNESPEVQDQILFSSIYDHMEKDQQNTLHEQYKANNLYTYDWIWKLEHPAHIKITPTKRESGKITSMGTFAYYSDPAGTGKGPEFSEQAPHVPTWQYILDIPKPNGSRDKRGAIARFAFIIIPKVAHLNPNAIADHTYCQKLSSASVKVPAISHANCTKCARKLGNSPAELMFGKPENFAGNGNNAINLGDGYYRTNPLGIAFEGERIKWQTIEEFCEFCGIIPPGLTAETNVIDNYVSDKNTVTRFMEIDNSGDREAYWSDDGYRKDGETKGKGDGIRDPQEYYHRFNMRRTDWENLKIEDIIGSKDDPDKAAPKVWNNPTDLQEPAISGGGNRNNFDTGGIAWLRNWKNKGDWGDAEKTQKQVVANLLNYCSPPTRPVVSNVESKNWNTVEEDGKEEYEPEYTGLKRTLYLNEYFYDVRFKSKVDADYNEAADETTIKVTYNFETEFMVELVDMYLNTLGDNNNHPVKFAETMKEPDFSTYYPEIYGTLTFKYRVNGETDNEDAYRTKTYKIHKDLNGLKFIRFEKDEGTNDTHFPIENKKNGYYGYYTENITSTSTEEEKANFEEVIDEYAKISGNASETFLKAGGGHEGKWPKIKAVTLKIDKILLYRTPTKAERDYREGRATDERDNTFPFDSTEKGETPDGEDFKEYVDCVLLSPKKSGRGSGEHAVEPGTGRERVLELEFDADSKKAFVAFCGGREAYDPRQNLQITDWSKMRGSNIQDSFDKPYSTEEAWAKGRKKIHTMPFTPNKGSLEHITGINSVLDPDKSGDEYIPRIKKSDNAPHDCETTNDPSWQLENGIKVAPTELDSHISTAFIRHAILRRTSGDDSPVVEHPMESLWELGAIHRGSKWQTLNLSKSPPKTTAEGFVNDGAGDYKDGDAPILDQVKMTNDCLSFGKINLVRHIDQEVRNTVVGALFRDMPIHKFGFYLSQGLDESTGLEDLDVFPNKDHEKTWTRIYDEKDPGSGQRSPTVKAETTGSSHNYSHIAYVTALYDVIFGDAGNTNPLKSAKDGENKFWRRTDFLAAPKTKGSAQDNEVKSDILYPIRQQDNYTTDAMEEQIIGRTINLMKVEEASVKGATAILLVQTLKDSGQNAIVYKDWNGDGKISSKDKATTEERENEIAQLQSGYRRFTEREKEKPPFFLPPAKNTERIKTGNRGLGTYQNGADTITGEVKVIMTLDFDTAKQKWNLVKYEYAE